MFLSQIKNNNQLQFLDSLKNCQHQDQQSLQLKVISLYELIERKTLNNIELKNKNDAMLIKTGVIKQTIDKIRKKNRKQENKSRDNNSQNTIKHRRNMSDIKNNNSLCSNNNQIFTKNSIKQLQCCSSVSQIQLKQNTQKLINKNSLTNKLLQDEKSPRTARATFGGIRRIKSQKSCFNINQNYRVVVGETIPVQ